MDYSPLNTVPWSDRLAFDVALMLEGSGDNLKEVLKRHDLNPDQLEAYNADPVFLTRVGEYRDNIREKGLTFRLKAKAQAEELLTTSWLLIHDTDVSPAVKADLIKSTVKWAGYEIRPENEVGDSGGGVKITINLGPQGPKVIEGVAGGTSDGLKLTVEDTV